MYVFDLAAAVSGTPFSQVFSTPHGSGVYSSIRSETTTSTALGGKQEWKRQWDSWQILSTEILGLHFTSLEEGWGERDIYIRRDCILTINKGHRGSCHIKDSSVEDYS